MKDVLRIMVPLLAWLATFSAVYGLHGIVCGFDLEGATIAGSSLPRILLASAWLLAILLQAALLAALHSDRFGSRSVFGRRVSRITGWAGLVATLWTLFPTVATSYCG